MKNVSSSHLVVLRYLMPSMIEKTPDVVVLHVGGNNITVKNIKNIDIHQLAKVHRHRHR